MSEFNKFISNLDNIVAVIKILQYKCVANFFLVALDVIIITQKPFC